MCDAGVEIGKASPEEPKENVIFFCCYTCPPWLG